MLTVLREWRNWQTRTFEGRVVLPYGFNSRLPHQKKALAQASAFFNEICPSGKWNSFAVKYLLCKCEIFADANVGKFHFTLRPTGAIFHNFRKEIISHSAQAEYFTKSFQFWSFSKFCRCISGSRHFFVWFSHNARCLAKRSPRCARCKRLCRRDKSGRADDIFCFCYLQLGCGVL